MNKLVLTESDLSTITNALTVARESCIEAARECTAGSDTQAAFGESAEQYNDLLNKIEAADTITVEM